LPNVLVLHLKRFDASSARKIEKFVGFPLKGLDMAPYVYEWRNAGGGGGGGGGKEGGKEDGGKVEKPAGSEREAAAVGGVEGEGEGDKKAAIMSQVDTTTRNSSGSNNSSSSSSSSSKKAEIPYDLFAVCEHLGTSLQQGHYKAYVQEGAVEGKGGGSGGGWTPAWYVCNDTWVLPVSEEEVLRAQGYVLFYVRRGWSPYMC